MSTTRRGGLTFPPLTAGVPQPRPAVTNPAFIPAAGFNLPVPQPIITLPQQQPLPVVEPKRVMFSEPIEVRPSSPRAQQSLVVTTPIPVTAAVAVPVATAPQVVTPQVATITESLPTVGVSEVLQQPGLHLGHTTPPITVAFPHPVPPTVTFAPQVVVAPPAAVITPPPSPPVVVQPAQLVQVTTPVPVAATALPVAATTSVVSEYNLSEVIAPTTVTLPAPTITLPTIRVTETVPAPVPQIQTMTVTASEDINGAPTIDINLMTSPAPPPVPVVVAPAPVVIAPAPVVVVPPEPVVIAPEPVCKISDKQSVENVLRNYLYTPIAKIIVKTESGKSGEYIKALDPLGIIVFVQLNNSGYVTIEKSDLTMVKSATTNMIPYSIKRSNFDLVGPHSSGVAIECNKGVCMIERSMTGREQETSYFFTEPVVDPTLVVHGTAAIMERRGDSYIVDDAMIARPIVSMRDIVANPVLTVQHTQISNAKLVKREAEECEATKCRFNQNYRDFSTKAKYFYTLHEQISKLLVEKRCEHELAVREYVRAQNRCEADNINYQLLLDDLRRRSELQTEIIKFCRILADIDRRVTEINADFDVINSRLVNDYREVGSLMRFPG